MIATDTAGNASTQTFRFYVKTFLWDVHIMLRRFEASGVIHGRAVLRLRNVLLSARAAEARLRPAGLVQLDRLRMQVRLHVDDEAASGALVRSSTPSPSSSADTAESRPSGSPGAARSRRGPE